MRGEHRISGSPIWTGSWACDHHVFSRG